MVGSAYPGCPPVARFVAGHLYELCLVYEQLVVFERKDKRYHFRLIASNRDKARYNSPRLIYGDESLRHFHIKEIDATLLPLYINYRYHTDIYRDLLSGQHVLAGKKCLAKS